MLLAIASTIRKWRRWGYVALAVNVILVAIAVFMPGILGDRKEPGSISNTKMQSIVLVLNYPIFMGVDALSRLAPENAIWPKVVAWIWLVMTFFIYWHLIGIACAYLIHRIRRQSQ